MLHKQRSTVSSLAALILLFGLAAGCGGSGGGESGSQEGAENGGGGGAEKAKKAPEKKTAIGQVVSVKADREKLILRPPKEVAGGERISFRVRKNAPITLGSKKAELADVKEGQQAQIEYVVNEEKNNRATSVKLFEGGGGGG